MAHLMFRLDSTWLDRELQSQVLQEGECRESKREAKRTQGTNRSQLCPPWEMEFVTQLPRGVVGCC